MTKYIWPGVFLVFCLVVFSCPTLLSAGSSILKWQPNTEPDFESYYLYQGTASRDYGPPIPVGNTPEYTLSGLEEGVVYYFAVSAVDIFGNESGFSEEVTYQVPSSITQDPGLQVHGVSASADDGNVPENTLDDDLSTRWSANGSGQWIQYDLGSAFEVSHAAIAFFKGDARTANFEIFVSDDASTWNSVFKGQSSGVTLQQQSFPLSNATGRFLRIVGYGNSSNAWNSITEIDIFGAPAPASDLTAPAVNILSPTQAAIYETSTSSIRLTGTVADDSDIVGVTWSNSNGESGAASGTTNWSTPDIALAEGNNTITVSAKDAAGNSGSTTLTVAYTARDTTAPEVTITSPVAAETFTTANFSISIAGTATDDKGLQEITWTSSSGNGTASGTNNWAINNIDLVEGANTIVVTATDNAGNQATDQIAVDYMPVEAGLPAVSVSASADDGNVPVNTVDDNLSTRWSAKGSGQWIQYDLGSFFSISQVAIAFFKGDKRKADFEIFVSNDANSWNSAYKGISSGATLQQETYPLASATGRFLRIVGYGNSSNAWNSITEVDIFGIPGAVPDVEVSIASVSASTDDGNVPANTVDDDLSTRWSAEGSGQWIQFDLGSTFKISEVAIAFFKGDDRTAHFEIFISDDVTTWSSVFKGSSSGTTLQPENYSLSDSTGRYVRIVGYENSSNAWNSITEVDILGTLAGLAASNF